MDERTQEAVPSPPQAKIRNFSKTEKAFRLFVEGEMTLEHGQEEEGRRGK